MCLISVQAFQDISRSACQAQLDMAILHLAQHALTSAESRHSWVWHCSRRVWDVLKCPPQYWPLTWPRSRYSMTEIRLCHLTRRPNGHLRMEEPPDARAAVSHVMQACHLKSHAGAVLLLVLLSVLFGSAYKSKASVIPPLFKEGYCQSLP